MSYFTVRKRWIIVLGLLASTLLCCDDRSFARQPNLVVFFSDDHGQKDSTPYGATDVRTPNMQRLAERGLVMTHAFVASPACAPSRAAMLTGLMPARNGAEANHTSKHPHIRSLVEDLKEIGYEVSAFGKVAHGKLAKDFGFSHVNEKHDLGTVRHYLETRDKDRPLCLLVGTHDPHVPWAPIQNYDPQKVILPAKFFDTPETRNNRARYYTDVTNADRELGEIYELVEQKLDSANTLFIYTSDHGAQWPFAKWNLYDAGIRVPMIAVWPNRIAPQRSDAMVSWIDLLPTLIDAGGGTVSKEIDGKSFLPVLLGKEKKHREEIYATHHNDGNKNIYPCRSIRTSRYKYILNLHPEWAHTTHIDQGGGSGDGWHYFREWDQLAKQDAQMKDNFMRYYNRPREELYDLTSDPDELHNLADDVANQTTLVDLRLKLETWRKSQPESDVKVEPRLLSNLKSWQFVLPANVPNPK